jgi:hypothetical protein
MRGDAKRDFPPTISYQQTYWKKYRYMNDYLARASYITRQGDYKTDILLLHPISTGWAVYDPKEEGGRAISFYDSELTKTLNNLLSIHRDFDFGDEIIMERHASVKNGVIKIAKGGMYKAIVVPPSLTWSLRTYELISTFLISGGKILFIGEKPSCIDGTQASKKWETIFRHKNASFSAMNQDEIKQTLDKILEKTVSIIDETGKEIDDIHVHHRIDGSKHILFMSNKSRNAAHKAVVWVKAFGEVSEYDMFDGSIKPLYAKEVNNGVEFKLDFSTAGSHAVVIDTGMALKEREPKRLNIENVLDLGMNWKFKRVDPNSMTIDLCRIRINGEEWSSIMPVWKARSEVWNKSGLKAYGGIQIWSLLEKGIKPAPNFIEMNAGFESEVTGKKVWIVIENAKNWKLNVNGVCVETQTEKWHWDINFNKIDITNLVKKGRNEINMSCIYSYDTYIEEIYLAGDFGVKKYTADTYCLSEEPKKLVNGDWCSQGYPFYSGNMEYITKVNLNPKKGNKYFLELKNPSGTVFTVKVNGKVKTLISNPWKFEITDYIKTGFNDITIEVTSSLRNTFGPLHHTDKYMKWTGPGKFTTNITSDYVFVPYGLIEGAGIIVYRESRQ